MIQQPSGSKSPVIIVFIIIKSLHHGLKSFYFATVSIANPVSFVFDKISKNVNNISPIIDISNRCREFL